MALLRCIQVDPLDVVGRNVHLVMQSRVQGFRPEILDALVYDTGELVETWDKVRSVVVSEDWANLRPFRRRMREAHEKSGNPPAAVLDYVRAELAARGRLTSLDLEDKGQADWRWAPARSVRAALEIMFDWGEIGIAGRVAGRKIYAPIADVLARGSAAGTSDSADVLDHDAYLRWHVLRRVAATGLIADRSGHAWLGIEGAGVGERRAALAACEAEGTIVRVAVEGVRADCY
ncbi:MAG TPA: crosslink repair DNA glycosylase YcaQ family protein, partial [Myxococcota bacterium]|nr:crosslink repair DNA glycosylase YcaQ family protein [Myxococcota bacterium]